MRSLLIIPILLFPSELALNNGVTLKELFNKAELRHGLPKNILSAIAKVESNTNHKAFVKEDGKSKNSSFGLLQLQYAAAKDVGFKGKPRDLMNPLINIEYGAAYLSKLIKRNNNDLALSLTAWNKGQNNKEVKEKKYSAYVGKVLNAWR